MKKAGHSQVVAVEMLPSGLTGCWMDVGCKNADEEKGSASRDCVRVGVLSCDEKEGRKGGRGRWTQVKT